MRILIVDDEKVALTSLRRILRRRGIRNVEICDNGGDAIRKVKEGDFDIVLLDLLMPGVDGMQVLEAAKPFKPRTEFVILTAVDDISAAVKAVRMGAYDYLVKPVANERLFLSIDRAYEHVGLLAGLAGARSGDDKAGAHKAFSRIITQCPRMMELLSYTRIMAKSGNPILITGESGTGKELAARGIHRAGPCPEGPFIAVNISSIPDTLFESQVFGHKKGAFTGAEDDYVGLFEQANGGTLFLDEIGELPQGLQVKLLRVLEEKIVTRVGSSKSISLNARVVSATNADMDKALREGRFRLDLLCRLKSAHVHLPPLKERVGDIPLLACHFLNAACMRKNRRVNGFGPEAMDIICHKEYPGNIRELKQLVENAVLMSDYNLILPQHLGVKETPASAHSGALCTLKDVQQKHVAHVLSHARGDRKEAARILGVSVRQVQRRVAEMKKDTRWQSLVEDL